MFCKPRQVQWLTMSCSPDRTTITETDRNRLGKLIRSHVGVSGDCAVASSDDRQFSSEISELGVVPDTLGPELGDKVIKSGRTTGVTHWVLRRVDVVAKITCPGAGMKNIGCFEIGPDANNPAPDGEISSQGDSGSRRCSSRRTAKRPPSKLLRDGDLPAAPEAIPGPLDLLSAIPW